MAPFFNLEPIFDEVKGPWLAGKNHSRPNGDENTRERKRGGYPAKREEDKKTPHAHLITLCNMCEIPDGDEHYIILCNLKRIEIKMGIA